MKKWHLGLILLILFSLSTSKITLGQIQVKGQGQIEANYDIKEFGETGAVRNSYRYLQVHPERVFSLTGKG